MPGVYCGSAVSERTCYALGGKSAHVPGEKVSTLSFYLALKLGTWSGCHHEFVTILVMPNFSTEDDARETWLGQAGDAA